MEIRVDSHQPEPEDLEKIKLMLDALKKQGDGLFRIGSYDAAASCYNKALEYLNFEKKEGQKNVVIDASLCVTFLNNMT